MMNPPAEKKSQNYMVKPSPLLLAKALEGVAVVTQGDRLLLGKVGEPGEVLWAPTDLKLPEGVRGTTAGGDDGGPFWRTEAGKDTKARIVFYRNLNPLWFGGTTSVALFYSYLVSGNREHLARFCAYLDDYTPVSYTHLTLPTNREV